MARTERYQWLPHESTLRGMCQAAFVLFGALPLMLVVAWVLLSFTPQYYRYRHEALQSTLSSRLGVVVRFDVVKEMSPTRCVLRGVRMLHPETQRRMMSAAEIDAEYYRGQWVVQTDRIQLQAGYMERVWHAVHDGWLCRPDQTVAPVVISASELSLADPTEDRLLRRVRMKFFPSEDTSLLKVDFQLVSSPVDVASQVTSQLIVERQRKRGQLQTRLVLDTGSAALPCSLLATACSDFQRFGRQATFAGVMDWAFSPGHWHVKLQPSEHGRWCGFGNVDLGQLTLAAGGMINGTGNLELESASISDSGIRSAFGKLEAGATQGFVSARLLQAAGEYLGIDNVAMHQAAPSSHTHYAYTRLDLLFRLEAAQLGLAGSMKRGEDMIALRRASEMARRIHSSQVLYALDHALAPADGPQSRQLIQAAMNWLPPDQQPGLVANGRQGLAPISR